MLSSVSSSSTITLHLPNRHQTFSHGAPQSVGLVGKTKGCTLPRDRVSTDLHYDTIKRLLSSSKVRENLSFHLFLLLPPHLPSKPSLCSLLKHQFSEVCSDILYSMCTSGASWRQSGQTVRVSH